MSTEMFARSEPDPALTHPHTTPETLGDLLVLVLTLTRHQRRPATALTPILNLMIAAGRIASWSSADDIPVEPLHAYLDPDHHWPELPVAGWIDHCGFDHLVPETQAVSNGASAALRLSAHQLRVREAIRSGPHVAERVSGLYATAVHIQPPPCPANTASVLCFCGHSAADHLLRDCSAPDRTGLRCSCTRFRRSEPIPAASRTGLARPINASTAA